MARKNPRQRSLDLRRERRRRRGRPPGKGRRPEPHRAREVFTRRRAVHVRLRIREEVPRLRRMKVLRALGRAFTLGCARPGFSICHFSIQSNHLHLVCEADHHEALARGMQGFGIRAAKAINKALGGRKGSVFAERYRVTRIATARQARSTLVYVLHNARRHGAKIQGADPFSSARYFDGFSRPIALPPTSATDPPVAPAETALLASRWRYLGLIDPDEMPAAAGR